MNREDALAVFFILLIVSALVAGVVKIALSLSFRGDFARIEQLRMDTELAGASPDAYLIGLIAEANQDLSGLKAYRKVWWARLFVPKGWENVELISIKKGERRVN